MTTNDTIELRVRQIAADIFSLRLDQVLPSSSPETIESWDSVRHLSLMLALEQELSIEIDPEEIERMSTIAETVVLVSEKTASA